MQPIFAQGNSRTLRRLETLRQEAQTEKVRNQSTVVVSQAWSEIHKVNERIRRGLKAQGFIGADEQTVTILEQTDLTAAQKRDKRFYTDESVLVFNLRTGGYKTGQVGRLLERVAGRARN